jgi:hypothetical protein
MKLNPDARAYARTVAPHAAYQEQIAKAYHDGMLHERARARRLGKLDVKAAADNLLSVVAEELVRFADVESDSRRSRHERHRAARAKVTA